VFTTGKTLAWSLDAPVFAELLLPADDELATCVVGWAVTLASVDEPLRVESVPQARVESNTTVTLDASAGPPKGRRARTSFWAAWCMHGR
jgi:hypothetical protein